MAHSYSSISKFNSCPRSYYHQYILKDVKFESSPEALYGANCHDNIDQQYRGVVKPTEQFKHLTPIVDLLKSQDGKVETEYPMAFNKDWSETTWFDKGSFIKGKADAVIFHPTKPLLKLWDYKFAKYKPANYELEMDMFTTLLFKKHPEVERIHTALLWLKEIHEPTKDVYNAENADKIEAKIMDNIERIEEATETENFRQTKSGLCFGWCGAKNCSAWRPKKEKY